MHPLSFYPEEADMHPVVDETLAGRGLRLGDLALVMREQVVLATRMHVEGLAQVLHGHGRTLDMPARIPPAPGGIPLLQIAGLRGPPEREVGGMPLVLVHLDTGARDAIVR